MCCHHVQFMNIIIIFSYGLAGDCRGLLATFQNNARSISLYAAFFKAADITRIQRAHSDPNFVVSAASKRIKYVDSKSLTL